MCGGGVCGGGVETFSPLSERRRGARQVVSVERSELLRRRGPDLALGLEPARADLRPFDVRAELCRVLCRCI